MPPPSMNKTTTNDRSSLPIPEREVGVSVVALTSVGACVITAYVKPCLDTASFGACVDRTAVGVSVGEWRRKQWYKIRYRQYSKFPRTLVQCKKNITITWNSFIKFLDTT
jgi:hypothetical protein